ncbi:MAG TPA: lipopolysaccharide biosynthesis protein [Candidatus Aquilonibacter sp.]|nr:lipopolysaccharide biosynthesis protein [Candidatus Aquilonibacter sp.]
MGNRIRQDGIGSAAITSSSAEPLQIASGAPSGDLKRTSVRGGAVAVLAQVTSMALQLGTTFVLARLLAPSDYGLQSMVLTLTAFVSLFKDAGLSVASVQRESLTQQQISTLFWINIALGFLLMLLVAAMAPALVRFYREPRLFWITIASSTIFFINSLAIQHRALLDRAMRFATNAKIDIVCAVAGTAVAIVMAVMKFGYWALICQNITLPIVGALVAWIVMPWRPGRPRWTAEMRSMLHFGGTVTVNGVVVYVAYNTEKILLGRYWGAAPLGIYGRAYQLATLPVQQLINAVHGVAFPVLSRLQSEAERLRRVYLKSLSLVVSLTIPVVIGSALFAEEIVRVVLGPKWTDSVPVLRLLAPTVMALALMNPFSWFLKATGRVGRSLRIAFLICPAVILGVLVGLRKGPAGVAMGYSVAMMLLLVPVIAWSKHNTGITARAYLDAVKRPLMAGLCGGAAGWLVQSAFRSQLTPVPLLAVELGMSSLVYALVLLLVMGQKEFYFDVARQILNRRRQVTA